MPNWKTYESSVRLLSAIVAAHPGLKLNYDDIGKIYGGGTTYKAVWGRMKVINDNAKALRAAFDAGRDTTEIVISETDLLIDFSGPDIAARFGGDCTKSAVENRFRRVKSDAKLINDAVKNGVDPITINVGDTSGEAAMSGNGSSACFGSNVTKSGLTHCFHRNIQPNVKLIRDARKQSVDPKDITMSCLLMMMAEIVKFYGSECTRSAFENHYKRDLAPNIKALKQAVGDGRDPKDVVLMENLLIDFVTDISSIMGSDTTPNGIRFQFTDRFKPIGKLQLEMKANGRDAKDIDLDSVKGKQKGQMAALYCICFLYSTLSFC
ncbi:uncharacterized protein LY89DRAFT_583877 [Mollisia scopiformis]|uniref:Uncharacterized protein n=1 Tax=Mollisia scopiformis TaxID=149040 RepID=A0A194XB09_MOLSC|nr:uncharacterized protein LY89DRAFT_583877 [Mollisia scopiformis]KUJ17356.1 hypothetical protein LY89DRAFT_583877 [Mollisia scopiformis]